MSHDKVSTTIQSEWIPQIFQCPKITESDWDLSIETEEPTDPSWDCEVMYSRQSTTDNKPKNPSKNCKFPSPKVTTDNSPRHWNRYYQNNSINSEILNGSVSRGTTEAAAVDIDKWLKPRTESVSSLEMDPLKSDVDGAVGQYLADELSHSFLEKDPHELIDLDLSDKKLSLGFDPILQELQSDKLLDVCEKHEFILPGFQLDQLDPLGLTPNEMMVAGEVLPSTSIQPHLSLAEPSEEYSSDDQVRPEEICDKATQVNVFDELVPGIENTLNDPKEQAIMEELIAETPATLENIPVITASEIEREIEVSCAPNCRTKSKLQPSIMKKRHKAPETQNNTVQRAEDCQTVRNDGIMAVVAISTDKRSNMTQIVINTERGEQIYQGKTSELMEATGYFTKQSNMGTGTWNRSMNDCPDSCGSNSNHELIITSALEELGYTDDILLSSAMPDNGNSWMCPREDCRREFNRLYALKSHLLTHYGVRPFKCDFEGCTWAFYSDFKLKRHKETHLKRKDYVCSIAGCDRRFTTVYNLWSHEKLHTRPNRIACAVPECEEKFQTKRALELHMKTHDESHASYVCPHEGCTKRYFSSNALTSHQRCHSYKEADVKCSWPGCGKIFDKPCRLKAHLRSHTGTKPYLCTYPGCEWAFASSSKLKRHQKKHTNDRKFVCDVVGCSKAFMRSEHLKEHKITHSEGRYFQCYICGDRFSAKSTLYVHIKKHQRNLDASRLRAVEQLDFPDEMTVDLSPNDAENTGGKVITVVKPRFACPVQNCDKSYLTKSSLKTHMIRRHGQKQDDSPPSDVAQVNWTQATMDSTSQIVAPVDSAILNATPDTTSALPEPEPPPRRPRILLANGSDRTKTRRNHGAARTGLTCADVWKIKSQGLVTLNSVANPSDVDLGTANLDDGLLLTEELPSMYYNDDIVGNECQILLLDAAVESTINLRDLE